MERYDAWAPLDGIASPCASVVLHAAYDVTVRLLFSEMRNAPPRDLLISFQERVFACTSFEEFVHPWEWEERGQVPRLGDPWAGYTFPLVRISDSRWLASFSDSQILAPERPSITHYRFLSLDNIVDVLAAGPVLSEWVAPAA